MKEQSRPVSFRQKYRLSLRGVALVVVLAVPAALYAAAKMEDHALIWGLVGLMAVAMALAVWAG